MLGSKKQIKWATDIKERKLERFQSFREQSKNGNGEKAVDFILGLEQASFWIDYRTVEPINMLRSLLTTGLHVWGHGFDRLAKLDPHTGVITITWTDFANGVAGEKRTETL